MRALRVHTPSAGGIRKLLKLMLRRTATSRAALFPHPRSPALERGGERSHRMARLDDGAKYLWRVTDYSRILNEETLIFSTLILLTVKRVK